jgi:molybdenum cofactor biosynthesis enzyme MoaA
MENQNQQSEPLCYAPFMHLFYKGDANISLMRPCCETRNTEKTSDITFADYKDYWTSEYMKNVRQQMLDGIVPEFCKNCLHIEKTLGYNARRIYNHMARRLSLEQPLKLSVETGNQYNAPLALDIRASNLCNLQCRMCKPGSSSQIAKEITNHQSEYLQADPDKIFDVTVKSANQYLYKKNNDTNNFVEQIPFENVKRMKLLGGEPLLHDESWLAIDKFSNSVNVEECELIFTTNGTVYPKDFDKIVSKFKLCKIMISLDGTGKDYEYVRSNGNWNVVKNNIKKFLNLSKHNKNVKIETSFVMQMYNILNVKDIAEFDAWFRSRGGNSVLYAHVEQNWLSTAFLTDKDRKHVLKSISSSPYVTREIKNILDFDKNRKLRKGEFEYFKNYTKLQDKLRNTNLNHLNKRYGKYLDG